MTPRSRIVQLAALSVATLLAFVLTAPVADAAPVVYEGFDYTDGTINGVSSYNGGTGFASAWVGSTTNIPFSMSDGTGQSHGGSGQPGLSFGTLSTTGSVTLTRKSAPGGAEVHRTLGASEVSTITGNTAYFSVLVRTKYYSVGNENLAFTIGTSDVFDPNQQPVNSTGEAIGFALDGVGSEIDFTAIAVDDGITSVSALGGLATADNTVFMIVGKIEWGATDTITLYANGGGGDGSTGSTLWENFSQFATLTADLDETQFDTISVAGQQVSSIDEIRIGSTLEDVGIFIIPEPSTMLLAGLGLAGLVLRRRRR